MRNPTGFTVKGVITLGCGWPDPPTVRVHSEATSLVDATTVGALSTSKDEKEIRAVGLWLETRIPR